MAQLMAGHEALGRLIEALGLQNRHISKAVIVLAVNQAVVCYVKHFMTEEEVDAVMDQVIEPTTAPAEPQIVTVGGLEVDEQGRVFVPAADYSRLRDALEQIANPTLGRGQTDRGIARRALEGK